MPDQIFENDRLVAIYDAFDGVRNDLQHYVDLTNELEAKSVVDVGCGTGIFARLLASKKLDVIGVDPAQGALDFARRQPNAEKVRWILGDASAVPPSCADLAVMTGNVAQVFLTDEAWENNLRAIHRALNVKGNLVFEVRDPAKKAWLDWTPEKTRQRVTLPRIGTVEGWCEVTEVAGQLISFRLSYLFEADRKTITSDTTLCFRSKEELLNSLKQAQFSVKEIRDAPDRPGKEFVFCCTRLEA